MIAGNAEVGKDGTQVGLVQGTHLLYAVKGKQMGTKLDRIGEMSVVRQLNIDESTCEEPGAEKLLAGICEG